MKPKLRLLVAAGLLALALLGLVPSPASAMPLPEAPAQPTATCSPAPKGQQDSGTDADCKKSAKTDDSQDIGPAIGLLLVVGIMLLVMVNRSGHGYQP